MELGEWSNGIGKHLVKLEDGKSAVGNFRGEVVRFYQHWVGGRGSICAGREACPLCNSTKEEDRKATGRFRVNFVTKDSDGNLVAKIFEGGRRVYDQLVSINKDIPLEKVWVRISRTGTKQNTQFMLAVLPGEAGMVTESAGKAILKVKLHDLSLRQEDESEEGAEEATA